MIFSFYNVKPAHRSSVSIAYTKLELSQYYVYGCSVKNVRLRLKLLGRKSEFNKIFRKASIHLSLTLTQE